MIARLWPGRRHLVLVIAGRKPMHVGMATNGRHAAERVADIAPEYGVPASQIKVRVFAPKGVRSA